MTLDVREAGKYQGDLKITKTGLTWCNGKAQNGTKKSWKDFIKWMNS